MVKSRSFRAGNGWSALSRIVHWNWIRSQRRFVREKADFPNKSKCSTSAFRSFRAQCSYVISSEAFPLVISSDGASCHFERRCLLSFRAKPVGRSREIWTRYSFTLTFHDVGVAAVEYRLFHIKGNLSSVRVTLYFKFFALDIRHKEGGNAKIILFFI